MYAPPQFREERCEVLHRAIDDIQFGALICSTPDDLMAAHLPMLLRKNVDGTTVIEGHVSRANDIWRQANGGPALAIFQGPQAYIRPGWYPSKKQNGRVVPTWNYIAVHVRGTLDAMKEEPWLRQHLDALTARNEAHRNEPWSIDDAPPDYVEKMLQGIVGLRLTIEKIEGSWKFGQHHPLENRLGAAAGLSASPNGGDREVGAIMELLAMGKAD